MNTTIEELLSQSKPLNKEEDYLHALEIILSAFDCSTGTIHRLGSDSGLLELEAQQGIPEVLMDKIDKIPLGKGIAGAAGKQREAVQMCNLQTDTSGVAKPDAKKTKVAGSLAVPILLGDTLVGTLGIGKFQPYDFNEDEVAQLNRVASWLGKSM